MEIKINTYNTEISVIISFFNEDVLVLKKSIQSIINQTYKNYEIIIVCDNPYNIDCINYIKKLCEKNKKIKFIINEENIGLVKSLNLALKISIGRYIARMDADDICEKNRFQVQVEYMNCNKVDILGSNIHLIDESENILKNRINILKSNNSIKIGLKYGNVVVHPSIMMKREVINELNEYRDVPYAEDYDLICRAVTRGFIVENLEDKLIKYRIRQNGISRSNKMEQENSLNYIRKLYKQRKLDDYKKCNIQNISITKYAIFNTLRSKINAVILKSICVVLR